MLLTPALERTARITATPVAKPVPVLPSSPQTCLEHAFAEIGAYIAIRDRLLAEAEDSGSEAKLTRALLANDFVENCLRPPRSPYEPQHLPEPDAARERKRCEAVRVRIAALRE